MKTKVLLLIAFAATAALAEDITLKWVPSGISPKTGYYKPVRAELSKDKPAFVTRVPEGVASPAFATLLLGPKDKPATVTLLIDDRDDGPSKLWLDSNANGDLTDDPPTNWSSRKSASTTTWSGAGQVTIDYGAEKRTLGLNIYRFDKNDPNRKSLASTVLYYRDYGLSGDVMIGDKSFKALLSDDTSRGDFTGNDVVLLLDINGDGHFDTKSERFVTSKPFNIGGTTYEIAGMTADGSRFQIVKSTQKVEEKVVPPALGIGSKAIAFEDQTTEGKKVKFPDDYKGKLVMLDFWATWCGPCIRELPGLTAAYKEFHDKGFEVLGISLDSEATKGKLPAFTKEKNMTWPQVCDGLGWESRIANLYGVRGIPSCWLVDGTTGLIIGTSRELRGEALRGTLELGLANLGKAGAGKSAEATKPVASPPVVQSAVVERTLALVKAGNIPSGSMIAAELKQPKPATIALPPVATAPLRGREIAQRAAAAHVRVGWVYQCTKCDRWHSNLAGGYAIARNAVATAHHVAQPPATMKAGSGHLVVVKGEDEVLGVQSVVAADEANDTVVLSLAKDSFQPLPLNADPQPGDSAYCYSDPRGIRGYFSTGIVNRLYQKIEGAADSHRMNVSTDWAPGSSGSAVLDECGNAIGHVARIQPLFGDQKPASDDDHGDKPTLMTLNEAVSAKVVRGLIEKVK